MLFRFYNKIKNGLIINWEGLVFYLWGNWMNKIEILVQNVWQDTGVTTVFCESCLTLQLHCCQHSTLYDCYKLHCTTFTDICWLHFAANFNLKTFLHKHSGSYSHNFFFSKACYIITWQNAQFKARIAIKGQIYGHM